MKLRSSVCFAFPPTHLTDSRSGIELLCFSGILSTSTSKSVVRRWLKKNKRKKRSRGPGTRQISLAFPPHNGSHLNFPIYCWSPVWMVPLMKCCFCGSTHEFQKPQGYIFLFLSLPSKLFGTGRDGMKKLRGQQVQTLDAAYQTSHRVKEHLNWLQTKLNKFQAIRLWHFVLMNFLTGYTYRQSMHKAPSCLHLYFWWLKLVFS